MNSVIEEIYNTGIVRDREGRTYRLHSSINQAEGDALARLIESDPTVTKTLEVGCAYGLSSLFICAALSARGDARHTIVDPKQTTQWNGVGIENLRRARLDFFDLIEQASEFALPSLACSQPNAFDLIFIDGMHTFDHTLLDLFYASRLVRLGGYVVIDDCGLPAVAKAVSYVSRWPAFQIHRPSLRHSSSKRRLVNFMMGRVSNAIPRSMLPGYVYDRHFISKMFPAMVILRKIEEDDRPWNWFVPF